MAYTTINKHTAHFNTKLYTGNGSTNAITGVGHQPDLVWTKRRDNTGNHSLYDVVRGVTKRLESDTADAEGTVATSLTAFDSDGFTLGSGGDSNGNGETYAAWNWKAGGAGSSNSDGTIASTVSVNTTAGFSIVKYTGPGSGSATVGHGLGVKPKLLIIKSMTNSENWGFWIDTTGNGTADKRLVLNGTASDYGSYFVSFQNNTFTLPSHNDGSWSGSGQNYIAYCFAEKTGYSKFGSYTGNNSSNNAFIYTGFKPKFFITKRSSDTAQWVLWDGVRDTTNPLYKFVYPSSNGGEGSSAYLDFVSNGVKIRDNNNKWGNGTYVFMAFGQTLVGSNNIPATAR